MVHQQALQKVINDTIRPPQREHARLAALREYNQSGRQCLSHKSVTSASVRSALSYPHAFATGGLSSVEVCTCTELLHLNVRRECLVEDTYFQMLHDCTKWAQRRQLIVKYAGEDGIDEGGLSKSSDNLLASQPPWFSV